MKHPVLSSSPLGFVWDTADPFLFCVHHDDAYPRGNEQLGPDVSLAGRQLGQDFTLRDGFRMYHGHVVPGFPQHPHRGFETITILRRGYIDHSDSMGAAARFGPGDVQWMTAGKGVVHSEMFPLLDRSGPNPVELFQIWINLPASDKLVEPHFSMSWAESVPVRVLKDDRGIPTVVTLISGSLGEDRGPAPPPRSWAARPDSHVAIAQIRIEPGGRYTLPEAPSSEVRRNLYLFAGGPVTIGERTYAPKVALSLDPTLPVPLEAGASAGGVSPDGVSSDGLGAELLLLQGRPIREPIAQYGPFVMNSRAQIEQAFVDYQRTRFGGWPWPKDDPVHPRDSGRFARHADGRIERPPGTEALADAAAAQQSAPSAPPAR